MPDVIHNLFRFLGFINPEHVGEAHGSMYAYENMETEPSELPPYEDFIFYQHHFLTSGLKRRYLSAFEQSAYHRLNRLHQALNIK